jgi:hypothetical protein
VTVTDANGCEDTDAVDVTVDPLPVADAGADKSFCFGDPAGAQIGGSPTGSGGTPPYTYSWSPAAGLDDATLANPTATPGASQTYTVTVTDANLCEDTDAVDVTVLENPTLACPLPAFQCDKDGVVALNPFCTDPVGGINPLVIFSGPGVSLNGGTGLYEFDPVAAGGPGIYQIDFEIVAANGCEASDFDEIEVLESPNAQLGPGEFCLSEGTVDLSGLASETTGQSGTGVFSGPCVSAAGILDLNCAGVGPEPVTYTFTSDNGTATEEDDCVDSAPAEYTIFANPVADAGGDQSFCFGNPVGVQIGGSPTASGGTGPYTYSWSPAAGLDDVTAANPTATPGASQTYTVTVTDDNGCEDTDDVDVTVNENPVCQLDPPDPLPGCGSSGNLLTVGRSGGTPPYTYEWEVTGAGTEVGTEDDGQTLVYDIDPVFPGTDISIHVIVKDANDCADTCWVDFQCVPEPACTFTQGFYGNEGGKFNGVGTFDLIFSLLDGNPLEVGEPGQRLSLNSGDVQCIIDHLPAGQTPTTLPAGEHSCAGGTIPEDNGHWSNVLLGQTVALSLNLRLSPQLCGQTLCPQMRTRAVTAGPDGLFGTADDALDPNDPDGKLFAFPAEVLAEATTICDLLDLANLTLAGGGTLSPSVVNHAVDQINRMFDGCRELTCCDESCPVPDPIVYFDEPESPKVFSLGQNHPNPFNPTTRITAYLPKATSWTIGIYNVAGQLVRRFEGSTGGPAELDVMWDGKDGHGQLVSTGIYFYRINAGEFSAVKKMVMLK